MSYEFWHRRDERPNRFAPRLRAMRQETGLSIPDFARLTGLSPVVYARLESGEIRLTAPVACRLAVGLGIEITRLFDPA